MAAKAATRPAPGERHERGNVGQTARPPERIEERESVSTVGMRICQRTLSRSYPENKQFCLIFVCILANTVKLPEPCDFRRSNPRPKPALSAVSRPAPLQSAPHSARALLFIVPPYPMRRLSLLLVALAFLIASSASNAESAAAVKAEARVSGFASQVQGADGETVLRLDKDSGRVVVEFNYVGRPLDLSVFRDLAVRVDNQTTAELEVMVTGLNDLTDTYKHSAQTRFFVRPAEQIDLCVFMARPRLPKDHPLIRRMGDLYAFPWGHQRHWTHVDASAIIRVTVALEWLDARAGQTIRIGAPFGHERYSVDPALLDSLELPVVDDFGQDRANSWHGKVGSLQELRADAVKDRALAEAFTRPRAGLSRFGGDLGSPQRGATGFFRVEKVDGKWWFVDPEGHLFWSLGVNGAGGSSTTKVAGREHLFPEALRGRQDYDHYLESVKLKHGEAEAAKIHDDVTLARMLDWGLNTVGAWSAPELSAARRVPYTLIIHVGYQGVGGIKKVADPYSEDFKKALEKNLSPLAALHADSPWLLGVFIDNELDWKNGIALPEEALRAAPRTPARRALIAFLQERYADLAALNLAWASDFTSFDSARPMPGPAATAAYKKDLEDYLTRFADAYFAACAAAMDKFFPNHLYLGCRFHTWNPLVTAAASRHCDVISANAYRYSVADFSLKTSVDRPYLIGEFHFGVRDHGVWGVGLTWASDARNQSDLVQAYLSDALRHPNIVGAHWFQWSGQAVTGRFDGENFGVGLVTIVDRPVTTLVDALRAVSEELYAYRLHPGAARIGAP